MCFSNYKTSTNLVLIFLCSALIFSCKSTQSPTSEYNCKNEDLYEIYKCDPVTKTVYTDGDIACDHQLRLMHIVKSKRSKCWQDPAVPGIDGLHCTDIGKFYLWAHYRHVLEKPIEIVNGSCDTYIHSENPITQLNPPYDKMIRRPGNCSLSQNYRMEAEETACSPVNYTGTYALVNACKPIFFDATQGSPDSKNGVKVFISFRIANFDREHRPGYGFEITSPNYIYGNISKTIIFYGSVYDEMYYGNGTFIKWKFNSQDNSAEGLAEITVYPKVPNGTSETYNVSLVKYHDPYSGIVPLKFGQNCNVTFTTNMQNGGGKLTSTKSMNVYLCENKNETNFYSDISKYNFRKNFMVYAKDIWETEVGASINTATIKLPETLIDGNGNIVLYSEDLPRREGATFNNITKAEFNNYVMPRFIVRLLNHFHRKYSKFNVPNHLALSEDPFNLDEPASFSAEYQNAMAIIVANGFAVKNYNVAATPNINATNALNSFLTNNGKVLNYQALTVNALTSAFGGTVDPTAERTSIKSFYTPICLISSYMSGQNFSKTAETNLYNGSIIVNTFHEMGHAWYKTEVIDEALHEEAMKPPFNEEFLHKSHVIRISGRGSKYCIMRTTSEDPSENYKIFQTNKIYQMGFSDGILDVLRRVNSVTYTRE